MNAPRQIYGLGAPMSANGYPPAQGMLRPNSVNAGQSTTTVETKVTHDPIPLSRTPSPTPSEQKELETGAVDWKTISRPKFWIRREWIWYYVAFVIAVSITALISIFHTQIVQALSPVTKWLHSFKLGWLVPIGVLFVLSFPPLFGHEIVAVLCGLVWGLWIGFGIVAAGTFIGEVGNFYAFKYCCRARGVKLERTKLTYACLARVVRDGGFKIALIARLSAIPGHFTTAIFSTCGMGIIVFSLAAILSLPKQFITVYLGVILDSSKPKDSKSKLISDVVLAITFIITIVAMWYIYHQMNKAKPLVIYDRRKARQAKLLRGLSGHRHEASTSTVNFNGHNGSDSHIPLTANLNGNQHWNSRSNPIDMEYGSDPEVNQIYAPKPQMSKDVFLPLNNVRDIEASGSHGRNDSTYSVAWDSNPHPTQPAYTTPPTSRSPHTRQPYFAGAVSQTSPRTETFVNSSSANRNTGHSGPHVRSQSPLEDYDSAEDAYGGYRPVTPPAVDRTTHHQQPSDSTFRTALTRASEDDPRDFPNPHDQQSSPNSRPPSYTLQPKNLR